MPPNTECLLMVMRACNEDPFDACPEGLGPLTGILASCIWTAPSAGLWKHLDDMPRDGLLKQVMNNDGSHGHPLEILPDCCQGFFLRAIIGYKSMVWAPCIGSKVLHGTTQANIRALTSLGIKSNDGWLQETMHCDKSTSWA